MRRKRSWWWKRDDWLQQQQATHEEAQPKKLTQKMATEQHLTRRLHVGTGRIPKMLHMHCLLLGADGGVCVGGCGHALRCNRCN